MHGSTESGYHERGRGVGYGGVKGVYPRDFLGVFEALGARTAPQAQFFGRFRGLSSLIPCQVPPLGPTAAPHRTGTGVRTLKSGVSAVLF